MGNLPTDKIISCFYDSSTDCVKVIDPKGMMLSFNPNGYKVMEIDNPRDVIGKDWLELWKGDMHDLAAQALHSAADGKVGRFEGYCPTFKGTMKYWEVSIAPLFNDYDEVQWLLVTSHDVTRRMELEELVTKQDTELRSLRSQLATA